MAPRQRLTNFIFQLFLPPPSTHVTQTQGTLCLLIDWVCPLPRRFLLLHLPKARPSYKPKTKCPFNMEALPSCRGQIVLPQAFCSHPVHTLLVNRMCIYGYKSFFQLQGVMSMFRGHTVYVFEPTVPTAVPYPWRWRLLLGVNAMCGLPGSVDKWRKQSILHYEPFAW